MKRLFVLLFAASLAAIAIQVPAHAERSTQAQTAEPCAADCDAEEGAPGNSEAHRGKVSPAGRPAMFMASVVCVSVTALSVVVLMARVRKQKLLAEARETRMAQEWAVQAAKLGKLPPTS